MTPEETLRELRYTAKKHENDIVHTFGTRISDMATDTARTIEDLLSIMTWISVTERLPERPQYDWVLVRTKFVPDGGYGVPHVAELRNGVWYSQDCDLGPMEEILSIEVTDWFDMQLLRAKNILDGTDRPAYMVKSFHVVMGNGSGHLSCHGHSGLRISSAVNQTPFSPGQSFAHFENSKFLFHW